MHDHGHIISTKSFLKQLLHYTTRRDTFKRYLVGKGVADTTAYMIEQSLSNDAIDDILSHIFQKTAVIERANNACRYEARQWKH